MANDRGFRIGDTDRSAALDALSTHFADGRLDVAEFDARTADAVAATHQSDLDKLFHDLPPLGEAAALAPSPETSPAQRELISEHELAEIKRKGEILKKTDLVTVIVMAALFALSFITSHTWLLYAGMAWVAVGLIGARVAIGMSDAEEDYFEELDAEEHQAREERLRLALKRRKELGH